MCRPRPVAIRAARPFAIRIRRGRRFEDWGLAQPGAAAWLPACWGPESSCRDPHHRLAFLPRTRRLYHPGPASAPDAPGLQCRRGASRFLLGILMYIISLVTRQSTRSRLGPACHLAWGDADIRRLGGRFVSYLQVLAGRGGCRSARCFPRGGIRIADVDGCRRGAGATSLDAHGLDTYHWYASGDFHGCESQES